MILKFILYCCLLYFGSGSFLPPYTTEPPKCLTGSMTDIQSWVDKNGQLIGQVTENILDLSGTKNPMGFLQQKMCFSKVTNLTDQCNYTIEYLSMAKCDLTSVPPIFKMKDIRGRPLYSTVRFLTLFGNKFHDKSSPGEHYNYVLNATNAIVIERGMTPFSVTLDHTWALGFQEIVFEKLKELDLRNSNIQILSSNTFCGMPELEALYLSDNNIVQVETGALHGLKKLIHLDLSRNFYYTQVTGVQMMSWGSVSIFNNLDNLASIDFSHTKLSSVNVLQRLGSNFQRLSLCNTGISRLRGYFFQNTGLRFLDVSGNNGILSDNNVLRGLEDTLEVLYADAVGLQLIDIVYRFEKLEILKVSNNEITGISPRLATSWTNMQIIDLDSNRIASWFSPIFSLIPNLKVLSLRTNHINMISEEMVVDIEKVSYVGFSENFFFCNCHSREFFDIAFFNDIKRSGYNRTLAPFSNRDCTHLATNFHMGFTHFNDLVHNRGPIYRNCSESKCTVFEVDDVTMKGDFLIFDYSDEAYNCFILDEGISAHFYELDTCNHKPRDNIDDVIRSSNSKLIALMVIPLLLLPVLAFGFVFRRSFKYFIITMRNTALLSLIHKPDVKDEDAIFNYDVFVSYCNEDRAWVLDHLLPHVENDCNVSVCLHERDFQVGLSILENIVSCMDRSRSIMLVISQRFLLSQWCQFEMHLAQHRLLETRREDLILILLEDIPRRFRPNTLHYLMLTKTYIVWPKEQSEHTVFWKRVKKSLVTQKVNQSENVSLA